MVKQMKKLFLFLLVGIFLIGFTSGSVDWRNGIIGYWSFNDTGTNTSSLNIANSSFNFTIGPALLFNNTACRISNCLIALNGSTSNKALGNTTNITHSGNQLTISAWINLSSVNQSTTSLFLAKTFNLQNDERSYQLAMFGSDQVGGENNILGATLYAGSLQGMLVGPKLIKGNLTYVAYTINTTTASLYISGKLYNSTTGSFLLNGSSGPLNIMNRGDGATPANSSLDEVGLWNRTLTPDEIDNLWNNGQGLAYNTNIPLTVNLISPIDTSSGFLHNINFTANYQMNGTSLLNATYFIWNSDGSLFNRTTVTVTGSISNSSILQINNLPNGNYSWNVLGANSTSTKFASYNFSFTVIATTVNTQTYNASTYETATESFAINLTYDSSYWNSIGAILNYAGVNYTGSQTGSGNNIIFNRSSVNIPTVSVPTNNNFYWTFSFSNSSTTVYSNSSITAQTVNPIFFTLCNASNNVTYTNFTFKNETAGQESITASITSSFFYWLGSGTVNKTYTLINSSVNTNYAFCFMPSTYTLNLQPNIQYTNPASIGRVYNPSPSLYTNSVTSTVLYLLPTSLGIYSRYVTQSTAGGIISGVAVLVTRTLGGSTINVGSGSTDDSGLFAIFLDPTAQYDYVFSKSGYNTNSFSLTPNSVDTYTVYMSSTGGSSSGQVTNGSTIGQNLSYSILPSNSSLLNNTDYIFQFTVNGTGIIRISQNITNASGYQLGYTGSGLIQNSINTGNYSIIIGLYKIETSQENFTFSKTWTVQNSYSGRYSLYTVMKSWDLYNFTYDYYRVIAVIITLFLFIGGLSKFEVIDTGESKIGVGILILWAYSVVGWLTMNISVVDPAYALTNSNIYALQQNVNQYGLALIATLAGIAYGGIKEAFN